MVLVFFTCGCDKKLLAAIFPLATALVNAGIAFVVGIACYWRNKKGWLRL
jgi:hypothetical protein